MTIPTLSGVAIAALDKTKFKIVACNASGDIYLVNHVYMFSDDGSIVTDLTQMREHNHSQDSEGGALNMIWSAIPEAIDVLFTKPNDMLKTNFEQTVSGTGSIEDNIDGNGYRNVNLRPNGTSGSSATIRFAHVLTAEYGTNIIFGFLADLDTATSVAFHGGIGADDITAADSNTRKIQAEFCTTTNDNWWLRTANGSANSASDTGQAITTVKDAIKLDYRIEDVGTPEADFEINAAGLLQKTTNIPIDSGSPTGNLAKFSHKNSTGADRPMHIYGFRISYITNSQWIYG